jgi:FtsH-binding integral membrane protein
MAVCFFSYFYRPFFQFQMNYPWVSYIFLGFVILFYFVIECTEAGRKYPYNLVILVLLTLSFSYIISQTTSVYANAFGGSLVIEALAITIALVVGLTVYAFVTRTDFTTWIGIVIVVLIGFTFFGIACATRWNPILHSLYCTFGAILAGILLVIDTQMIVGGDRSIEISMDDYVLGALIIYIDIVRLFLFILRAMGSKKR